MRPLTVAREGRLVAEWSSRLDCPALRADMIKFMMGSGNISLVPNVLHNVGIKRPKTLLVLVKTLVNHLLPELVIILR